MSGHFSFMPAYWNVFDVSAARAMLRMRLDVACNEGALRSNLPISLKQLGGQHHAIKSIVRNKIADRALRACYLCGEINGQPGVFESESLYHMLVECPHPSMALCRGRLKHDVFELSRSEEAVLQSPQALAFDQSEIWAVMMLCTSSVSFTVQPQMADPLHRPWTQLEVKPTE